MEDQEKLFTVETEIVRVLKNIYDPEIPVNVYDLGLIYDINVSDDMNVGIRMTLTAPNCPMADELLAEVHEKVKEVEGVSKVEVRLVFDPPWDKDMLSDEAKLELGWL